MTRIVVPTSFNIELDFETAPFHMRLFAWLVDFVIMICYFFILRQVFMSYIDSNSYSNDNLPYLYNISWTWVILSMPMLLYHLLCEIFMNGQSVGKKIFGLRVINATGGRPAIHQFLLRWLLRTADFSFTFCLGAFFTVLLSKRDQRLGDLAAGTLVINSRLKSNLDDTVFFEVEDTYVPRFQNVLLLSDRDMNVIKNILNTGSSTRRESMANYASTKIISVLGIKDYYSPIELLETVLKDYNYLSARN